jgi:hypothetical protein
MIGPATIISMEKSAALDRITSATALLPRSGSSARTSTLYRIKRRAMRSADRRRQPEPKNADVRQESATLFVL